MDEHRYELKPEAKTTIKVGSDEITIMDTLVGHAVKQHLDLKERAIRDGLIKLGWTPPNTRPEPPTVVDDEYIDKFTDMQMEGIRSKNTGQAKSVEKIFIEEVAPIDKAAWEGLTIKGSEKCPDRAHTFRGFADMAGNCFTCGGSVLKEKSHG